MENERKYCVYKYTNVVNGKIYVGLTGTSLTKRAGNGEHYKGCNHFYEAIKKYGWDAFTPEILEDGLTLEEANQREQYYIATLHSDDHDIGYNINPGGACGPVTEQTKRLISEKAKERLCDPKNNPMYGKHISEEAKRAIARGGRLRTGANNPRYHIQYTEEMRKRASDIMYRMQEEEPDKFQRIVDAARRAAIGNKRRAKRVRCIDTGEEWESCTAAANSIGVSVGSLCSHINGRRAKTCRGRRYEYVDNEV